MNAPLKSALAVCREIRWPLVALALLLAGNALWTPGFFQLEARDGRLYGVMIDILNHGSKTAIVALGMTLVIATGGVDLSVGAVMAIGGAILATAVAQAHFAAPIAIALALLAGVVAGLFNGALVAYLGLQPIVATLVLMVAGRGVAQLFTDGAIVTFEHRGLAMIGNDAFLGLPLPVTLMAVLLALTALVMHRSAARLMIEAVGDNERAARLAGVPVARSKLAVYGFCGVCAALAGLIECSYIKAADANNAGQLMELDAILAVVIGGTALSGGRFRLLGTIVGALLMQALTKSLYMHDVSAEIAPAPKAAVVILVCMLQSPQLRALFLKPRQVGHLPSENVEHPPSVVREEKPRSALTSNGGQLFMKQTTEGGCSTTTEGGCSTTTEGGCSTWIRSRGGLSLAATATVLVALFSGGAIAYPHFGSIEVVRNLLVDNAFLGVAALGATIVILSGGIDLSVGSVMALTSILLATLIERAGLHPLAAIPIVISLALLFGLTQGALIQCFDLPPFMVTLAGLFFARAVAFAVAPQSAGITHPFVGETLGERCSLAIHMGTSEVVLPLTVLVWILATAAVLILLTQFRLGRSIYAIGDDAHAAKLMGVSVGGTRFAVYALAGALSGLAGVVFSLYQQSGDPAACKGLELDAIAAVVIGGTLLRGGVGSVLGTTMGVLILGLIQTVLAFQGNLSSWWARIAIGGLLLLFVGLQRILESTIGRLNRS